jgi:hypothetical protein
MSHSELAPTWLARVYELELYGPDSEEANDGRLVPVLLDPVIMRGSRDAPDESFRGNSGEKRGAQQSPARRTNPISGKEYVRRQNPVQDLTMTHLSAPRRSRV